MATDVFLTEVCPTCDDTGWDKNHKPILPCGACTVRERIIRRGQKLKERKDNG